MSKTAKMNNFVYRALYVDYVNRNASDADLRKYQERLVFHKVTEAALVAEIERRGGK